MTLRRPPSRALTTFAVGFLALDAVLFVYGGVSLGRPLLVVAGAACSLGAALVVLGWRRYCRAMAELDQARQDMRAEVESIRELLHSKHLNN
jgi:hypothetical protein